MQISATQERAVASVPFASLNAPYAVVPRSRLIPRSPRPVLLTRASLFERLAAVLVESPPNDDIRGVRGPLGSLFARESSVCGDGAVRFVEAGGGF